MTLRKCEHLTVLPRFDLSTHQHQVFGKFLSERNFAAMTGPDGERGKASQMFSCATLMTSIGECLKSGSLANQGPSVAPDYRKSAPSLAIPAAIVASSASEKLSRIVLPPDPSA